MNIDDFRMHMESYRRSADEESRAMKDPQLVLDRLRTFYRRLNAGDRELANQVFAEWVLSNDENVRFDALAMVDELRIKCAVPALSKLAARLSLSSAPGAPYEMQKIARILQHFASR